MKQIILASALSLAMAICMTGCAEPPQARQIAVSPVGPASRAMLAAESAFNVAATAELDAKSIGLLSGDKAAKADLVRKQAYTALLAAREIYAGGAAPDLAQLLQLTNQLLILAGQQPVQIPLLSRPRQRSDLEGL